MFPWHGSPASSSPSRNWDRAPPLVRETALPGETLLPCSGARPSVNARSASSDEVVALSSRSIELLNGRRAIRQAWRGRLDAARPSSVSTCSLDAASRCSRAMDSPVPQLAAFKEIT